MIFQLRQLSADEQRQYQEIEERMMERFSRFISESSPAIRDSIMAELEILAHNKWEILNAIQQRYTGQISSHVSPGTVHAQVGCLSAAAESSHYTATDIEMIHN